MKKLYFLTRENKDSLLNHIQLLKNENYNIKSENKISITNGKQQK